MTVVEKSESSAEQVSRLLKTFIPDMSVKMKNYKTPECPLEHLVGFGLRGNVRKDHLVRFSVAMKVCTGAYIDARMGAECEKEELMLKQEFAERVIEEYLDRVDDAAANTAMAWNKTRRVPGRVNSVSPFHWDRLIDSWIGTGTLAPA